VIPSLVETEIAQRDFGLRPWAQQRRRAAGRDRHGIVAGAVPSIVTLVPATSATTLSPSAKIGTASRRGPAIWSRRPCPGRRRLVGSRCADDARALLAQQFLSPAAAAARSSPVARFEAARLRSMKPCRNSRCEFLGAAQCGQETGIAARPRRQFCREQRPEGRAPAFASRRRASLADHRIVGTASPRLPFRRRISTRSPFHSELQRKRACRSTAKSRASDPRHKAALRPRGRWRTCLGERQLLAGGDAELPLDQIEPVIASVTDARPAAACSCSMNQKPSALSPLAPSAMTDGAGTDVTAAFAAATAPAHRRRASPRSCRAPALPRSLSDGVVAAGNRARR